MNSDWRKEQHQELIACLCTDFSNITRGRSFPEKDLRSKLKSGVGWVPINQTITSLDGIANIDRWGSHGDLRLIPAPETETIVDLGLGAPPVHFFLGNLVELDGENWDLCTRSFLQGALKQLREVTGAEVTAAFEHEFVFLDLDTDKNPGFSYRANRQSEPFASLFMTALEQAGQQPETWLPEFGQNQFEYTCRPAVGVAAADRAVITREIAHDTASQLGKKISFSPKPVLDDVGNGVHIHISLKDKHGNNALYDSANAHGLSELGEQFAAGIIRYLSAILAFTAPSAVSYLRLQPHSWSSAYTCFGDKNREASLRICPIENMTGKSAEEQFHFEFRAADATANPYLALAAVLLAGLEGIKEKLPAPNMMNSDPSELSEAERKELGINRLPTSFEDTLAVLEQTSAVKSWFTSDFFTSYIATKSSELDAVKGDSDASLCERYRAIF